MIAKSCAPGALRRELNILICRCEFNAERGDWLRSVDVARGAHRPAVDGTALRRGAGHGGTVGRVVDTMRTKSIAEHHAAAGLARHVWALAIYVMRTAG
jgi:hypothetical protein